MLNAIFIIVIIICDCFLGGGQYCKDYLKMMFITHIVKKTNKLIDDDYN